MKISDIIFRLESHKEKYGDVDILGISSIISTNPTSISRPIVLFDNYFLTQMYRGDVKDKKDVYIILVKK